ncbi:hypothetical protein [Dokdonella soli]|uniref:Uncharacterized protein n=1 Tax=Dokdonella soli TaxID=529810 RepID=A0ABN1IBK4_9GAMM
MRSFSVGPLLKLAALVLATTLVAACGMFGRNKADTVPAANIPAGFDVTILADKDNQFDFDGAPLTAEDLKSAFRYRQEESLPMSSVLLKRGEKQKVKNEHIVALARLAYEMHFKAYLEEKGGISELQAQMKDSDSDKARSEQQEAKHAKEDKQ